MIVQSPQQLVDPGRKIYVDIEGWVWTVIAVGLRLVFVFITAEEMDAVLDDRAPERSAQLLIRIRQHALRYKIRGVERVVPEISGKCAVESIRS